MKIERVIYRWKDRNTFARAFSRRIKQTGQDVRYRLAAHLPDFVEKVADSLAELVEPETEFSLAIRANHPAARQHEIVVSRALRIRKGFAKSTGFEEIGTFLVDLRKLEESTP